MAGHDPHDETPESTASRRPTEETARTERSAEQSHPRGRDPLRPVPGRDLVALNRREPPAAPRTPASDTSDAATPRADALDPDRILELPSRRVDASRADRQPDGEDAPEPARITRILPAVPRETARLRVLPSSARPMSQGMTSLREAAQPYLARLAGRRGSDGVSAASSDGDTQDAAATSGNTRPKGKRRELAATAAVCPLCHGTGFVRLDLPVGDKLFGQAVRCECKEREIEARERQKLRDLSSLKPFDKKTFETFDHVIPGVAEAYDVVRRYADDPSGWLILQGGYGCGKTHLAVAIARKREDAGETVFFSIVPDLLDHLRATYAPASEITYDELFDRVRHVGLLVLDDLGSENATAWATEKLFQIINYRYNYRLPTVITTNVRLLSHLDDRIRSRLSDLSLVRWVKIEAGDYRDRHVGQGGAARPPRGGGSGPRSRGNGR